MDTFVEISKADAKLLVKANSYDNDFQRGFFGRPKGYTGEMFLLSPEGTKLGLLRKYNRKTRKELFIPRWYIWGYADDNSDVKKTLARLEKLREKASS